VGRLHRAAAITALVASACATGATTPPAPPSDLVPGLESGSVRTLTTEDLAADAFAPDDLARLLERAGLRGAIERSYAGGRAEIRRVRVRIARFGSPTGADRYLGWLDRFDEQLIGENEVVAALTIPPGTVVRLHRPEGCCAKELPVALAAWRVGTDVMVVTVSGPGVDGDTAVSVVLRAHEVLGKTAE
jgi:hypothetical protein